MSIESRSHFNNAVAPGLFGFAKNGFKENKDNFKELYAMRTSRRAYEESSFRSGFSYLAEKPEGTPTQMDARIQGHLKRWSHTTWALMCRITEEAIEDLLYGVMEGAMADLGRAASMTRRLLAARLLMNGSATTYHTAGDGLAVFSASHERLDGGTWSNLYAAADPNETSITAAVKNFEAVVDHRGQPYDQRAEGIWCGPEWEFTMAKMLGSEKEPDTNRNALNAVKNRRNLKLTIIEEITDGRWGVYGRKDKTVGLIWFDRVKPTMSRHGDPDTGDAKFYVRMRCSNEVNDPRQIAMVAPYST